MPCDALAVMRCATYIVLAAAVTVTSSVAFRAAAPIHVMLLDGESGGPYHNWRATTQVLKKMLDETGLFDVDVVSAPPATESFSAFTPDFATYQAIVLNYDAPDDRWPADLKAAFEQYVSAGGGVVVVHAADNAFPGWKAFNEMIGVGGWRNRTENAGPFWFFRDGKLTSDTAPGRAGSHGQRLPFKLTVRDANHPITKGLPAVWMHQADELYAALRGPGLNMTVLATAHSDPSNNGTGRDEPQLMVLSFGRGRVFHTTMGHDVSALSSVDFVATFQRGTEWAATGAVTQKIPAAFPTADAVRVRADLAAMDQPPPPPAAGPPPPRPPQASPAAVPPPQTATPQSYPAEQVRAGQPLFAAQCGFCHGRDAMGGESGPDLTRSASSRPTCAATRSVRSSARAAPTRACRRSRSPTPTSRRSSRSSTTRRRRPTSLTGGRRAVDVADLQTGNAAAGRAVLQRRACAKLPLGDRRSRGHRDARSRGSTLLQRMLYPTPAPTARRAHGRRSPSRRPSRRDRHRDARLSRRVHDCAHRRGGRVPLVADEPGEVHGRRSARGARRAARKVHRRRHARCARVPADASLDAGHEGRRAYVRSRCCAHRDGAGARSRRRSSSRRPTAGPRITATTRASATAALTQITPDNVHQLTLAWAFQTGQAQQIKATPILVNGVIYLTTPDNSGRSTRASARQIWRYTLSDERRASTSATAARRSTRTRST